MQLSLTNNLTRSQQPFVPQDPNRVTLYVCGPTVYGDSHIGNGRSAVVFDVLVRLLRVLYPKVVYVRNITDIDDKISTLAAAEETTIDVIAARYYAQYCDDMRALQVFPPDIEPHATAYIADMLEMIAQLLSSGHAYVAGRHVMFDITRDAEYGTLALRTRNEMLAGARVEVSSFKRNSGDFVLWKPSDASTAGWDSPYGRGRPGWHIECSAMIRAHLGAMIDIHGGGLDLQFPHHENEAAQSRCVHGVPLARFWIHNGLLNMGGHKMSKSQGNIMTISDLRERYSGAVLRLALLSGHYRQPLEFSEALLVQSEATLARLHQRMRRIADIEASAVSVDAPVLAPVMAALCDDLNTPKALAAFYALVRAADNAEGKAAVLKAGTLLGVFQDELAADRDENLNRDNALDTMISSPTEIAELLEARDAARVAGDYVRADALRDTLYAMGVEIRDTKDGTKIERAHRSTK